MLVDEIIDQALSQGDNVSPSSQDYLERRRLALSFLRETSKEFWWLRDWPCRRRNDVTVIIPAGVGYTNLPVDFNSLGVFGAVFNDNGDKLEETAESVIWDFNAAPDYGTAEPRYYALHSQDEETFLGRIVVPRNTSSLRLHLFYQANPPFLLDAGDTAGYGAAVVISSLTYDPATGFVSAICTNHGFENGERVLISGATDGGGPVTYFNGSFEVTVYSANEFRYQPLGAPIPPAAGAPVVALDVAWANRAILRIPSKYHDTVLIWGIRAKLRESKGDARWEYALGEYTKGLKGAMVEEARAQSRRAGDMQLPSFFGNSRGAY